MNQDDVIDIRDALAIQQAWNKSERASDINFDGVVNEKDMQYVVNNYLSKTLMSRTRRHLLNKSMERHSKIF